MYINSVNLNHYQTTLQLNNFQKHMHRNTMSGNTVDRFTKMSAPSFKGYTVNKKKFNILNQTDTSLNNLAEVFYNESDTDIKKACEVRYSNFIADLFADSGKEKYKLAYQKFMPYVEKTREHAQNTENRINTLTELAAKGDSNITEQERIISKTFFELLKVEQTGRKIPDNNGILIYGDAPNADKEEFIEWFKNNVPAQVKEFTYDEAAPFESIKKMVYIAEDAEKIYQFTGKRTILQLKDMDKLLTSDETLENIKMIARFKQFAEHCSERYHTTLLMSTNYPLDNFEDASIASHRFETKLKLKDGIKPQQKEELKTLQDEKSRLEKAAATVEEYFWYRYDDTDNSSDGDKYVQGGTWGDFCDYWKYS